MQVQAALFLKNLVCNAWNTAPSNQLVDKENVIPNKAPVQQTITPGDREFLKAHVVEALDMVVHLAEDQQAKVIVSSLENVIWNIAQCDYETWSKTCLLSQI